MPAWVGVEKCRNFLIKIASHRSSVRRLKSSAPWFAYSVPPAGGVEMKYFAYSAPFRFDSEFLTMLTTGKDCTLETVLTENGLPNPSLYLNVITRSIITGFVRTLLRKPPICGSNLGCTGTLTGKPSKCATKYLESGYRSLCSRSIPFWSRAYQTG